MATLLKSCPHCGSELVNHGPGSTKAGYSHCNNCGCCMDESTGEQREGHPLCNPALQADTSEDAAVMRNRIKELEAQLESGPPVLSPEQQAALETSQKAVETAEAELKAKNDRIAELEKQLASTAKSEEPKK